MAGISSSQNPGIPGQLPADPSVSTTPLPVQTIPQPSSGGLQGRLLKLSDGTEGPRLRAMADEIRSFLDGPRPASPYDDLSIGIEEQVEIFNRDARLHQELKEAVAQREAKNAPKMTVREEVMPELNLHGEEARLRDEVFSALARSNVDNPRYATPFDDPGLSFEEGFEIINRDARLHRELKEAVAARSAAQATRAASPETAESISLPVAVGNGEQRAATLTWAKRARAAFAAFFAPVGHGLAAFGRFIAELPGRLWAGLNGSREKTGGPELDRRLADYLQKPPGLKELEDDRRPASLEGDSRYICRGMKKDFARMDYVIGERKMPRPTADWSEADKEAAVQDAATALLEECQGDADLCMAVSYFAFQNIVGFQTRGVQEGWLVPEGVSSRVVMIEQPKEKSLSIKRLDDGGIHMLFNLKNEAVDYLVNGKAEAVQLDPASSVATTRFSFVVRAGQRVEPYPLNPHSADKSAVAYDIRVTPLPDREH